MSMLQRWGGRQSRWGPPSTSTPVSSRRPRTGCRQAEPRRLWRRYVLLNPLYCIMIAAQALGLAKTRMARQVEPREALRHG